jgi:hypothetical protein
LGDFRPKVWTGVVRQKMGHRTRESEAYGRQLGER